MSVARNTNQDPLTTSVQFVKGVGPNLAMLLGKRGIQTVADLLAYYPYRYENRGDQQPIAQLRDSGKVTVIGRLSGSEGVRTNNGKFLFKAYLEDGTGILELVFFN
ncbi:MAG TPA: DNA helicase RecG, partial [Armatimonadota bacterium]|nr:DNA helicase RecG [Armatimonadota bacterium]